MPLAYAFKHVFRSWKLFLALLIGITLASTFFAGIDIKANVTAEQALDQELSHIYVDMQADIQNLDSTQMLDVKEKIMSVKGVADAEVISRAYGLIKLADGNDSVYEYHIRVVGIGSNSRVYEGWLNRPQAGIGENETYIPENSPLASEVKIGDVIMVNFSASIFHGETVAVPLNLTVRGFAQLDDEAYSIANGCFRLLLGMTAQRSVPGKMETSFLLVSWEKTMRKILEAEIETSVLIYLNREALVTPWDVETSISNIETIKNDIENKVSTDLGLNIYVQNNLEWRLHAFRFSLMALRFAFTLVSLPIFFMAWYMGTTVSDVSFNLRRREIGLLSTKGFSRGQILRIFLTETLLIGLIGGLLGVLFGFLLNPLFTQFSTDTLFNPQMVNPYTMIFTVAFGLIIAFLSTYRSAKKASQLPTVDALREYLPMEEEKTYKKKWPWVAFILGTYKIIVFILGINMTAELTRIMFGRGNFILMLMIVIFLSVDGVLNYIGPLLFFWGFTKLFIQGSIKFQELTAKAAKFLGDLGALATKNVRRNPARSAAIAFLIALIVGYSVQVTGQLASEQDYNVRQICYQIGADMAVHVPYADNASNILNLIMMNVSEHVENTTIEYSFSASSRGVGSIGLKAVEPQSWLKTAYYESGWFSGNDVETAFNNLAADEDTIILERSLAKPLNLEMGDKVALSFGYATKSLKVVGFFGPESSEQQQVMIQTSTLYWSFISEELYEEVSGYVSASAKILLKLKGGVDGKGVAENIRNLDLDISQVESFAEEWEEAQSNVIMVGMLDVQRLGIVFAVLAASVGTALVSSVSMRERSREATIMSVKGLSYKQLVVMFLTENLAVAIFSMLLGVSVGLVVVHGNISAANAYASTIPTRRLVFSPDFTLSLIFCLALIFVSMISPILIMSRKYVTNLERMVRLR